MKESEKRITSVLGQLILGYPRETALALERLLAEGHECVRSVARVVLDSHLSEPDGPNDIVEAQHSARRVQIRVGTFGGAGVAIVAVVCVATRQQLKVANSSRKKTNEEFAKERASPSAGPCRSCKHRSPQALECLFRRCTLSVLYY